MGVKNPITQSFNLPDGREVIIETGKLAAQADGSVVVKCGNTMLFASVVSSRKQSEASFFPLTVDYQEKFAAAGRIPGNFFRREARLSEYEILTSRLVDRAIRPMFPDNYMSDTQVQINLISGEDDTLPDAFAALAASAAIAVSDIPFAGPISEVRVAQIDGKYVINPQKSDLERARLEIIIAADKDNVVMVEGEADECSERELIEAIQVGHEAIKVQCEAQEKLAQKVGQKALEKREIPEAVHIPEIDEFVVTYCKDQINAVAHKSTEKFERRDAFDLIKEAYENAALEKFGEEYFEENAGYISSAYDNLMRDLIRGMILDEKQRLDGRKPQDIRDIWCEVDYLPSAHGSGIFTRGETQALATVTLGTKEDQMLIDKALERYDEDFYLHYNFPALSVGEVKPNRGPSRREIGHANLAARSLKQVLPDDYAHTIRIVSDVLESNGSSSMATVCAGTLALQDAGIQIKKPVSGIAMGMISDGDNHVVLSDILGDEDHLGDMDFKVTGTKDGICACQMDIKIQGLPYEVLEQALMQAKEGRIHILNEMAKEIAEPREDLKPHAPRIVEFAIDKEFIGAVIGPGGKIIQEIQATTNTIISIEEVGKKGIVNIASSNKDDLDRAVRRVKDIAYTPEVGDVFEGRVDSIKPYGAFIDFNGKSGLLHVSEIDNKRVDDVTEYFQEGDTIQVKIIGIDERSGKIRLSRKALL